MLVVNPGCPANSGCGSVPKIESTGAAVPIGSDTATEDILPPGPFVRTRRFPIRDTATLFASKVAFSTGTFWLTTVAVSLGPGTVRSTSAVVKTVVNGRPSNTISLLARSGEAATVNVVGLAVPARIAAGCTLNMTGRTSEPAKSFVRLLSELTVTFSVAGLNVKPAATGRTVYVPAGRFCAVYAPN